MHLDPNDAKKIQTLFSNKSPFYELQFEDRPRYNYDDGHTRNYNNGFLGQWKDFSKIHNNSNDNDDSVDDNVKLEPTSKNASLNLFPITTTVHDLSFDKVYR